jgi:hypothetical protein
MTIRPIEMTGQRRPSMFSWRSGISIVRDSWTEPGKVFPSV